MHCLRCQHENRPQATFCEECAGPLNGASTVTRPHADDLKAEVESLRRALTESLEQQTATAEILRVISTSPMELQPLLDAVVRSAARFCGAQDAEIYHLDGEGLKVAAHHGHISAPVGRVIPVVRGTAAGRAVLERRPVHVADLLAEAEDFPVGSALAREFGYRTGLAVPLLREGTAIGTINLRRTKVQPFADKEIALLQTFADQAVIAIENVRLFNETKEALEQQTATADILRIIASSPSDLQPVFDAIAERAMHLCGASAAGVSRFDGKLVHNVALANVSPERAAAIRSMFPMPPSPRSAAARSILTGGIVHIPDIVEDAEYGIATQTQEAFRSVVSVPMLHKGKAIGAVAVGRPAPGPFSENQVALLQTFADQAVIAIENVRLFKELQARTTDLTRSVQELRALGEVSRAVSATLDLETVLNTVVSRASQLSGADAGSIFEYDEATREFRLRAAHHYDPAVVEAARRTPLHLGEGLMGRAAEQREAIQVPDIAIEGAYESRLRDVLLRTGYRAILAVPLIREDQIIGALTVNRRAPGVFAPELIEILKTFATQSALAIQNARLFHEIADKGRQLEAASRHKSEFLANMSHELRTPLNAILGFSEVLAERMFGEVNEKQAEYLEDILSSGRHLLSLINDILDLSKVEAGRLELEPGRFHLPTALDNALTLVRERATRHGITLSQTVDTGVVDIIADERKVKQILLNLLSNAVKFTLEGGRVSVTVTAAEDAITIAVSDTGIGIAPRRPLTDVALDPDPPSVQLHELLGERQAQPRALLLPSVLATDLAELLAFSFTLPIRLDEKGASDQGGGEPPRP
jgi:two-component system, NtrC family, sensor kinase